VAGGSEVGPVAHEVCGAEAEQSAPGRGTCGTTEGPFGKSAYDAVEGPPPPHEVTRGTVKVLAVYVPANPLAMLEPRPAPAPHCNKLLRDCAPGLLQIGSTAPRTGPSLTAKVSTTLPGSENGKPTTRRITQA
jgi:hypothetical protein